MIASINIRYTCRSIDFSSCTLQLIFWIYRMHIYPQCASNADDWQHKSKPRAFAIHFYCHKFNMHVYQVYVFGFSLIDAVKSKNYLILPVWEIVLQSTVFVFAKIFWGTTFKKFWTALKRVAVCLCTRVFRTGSHRCELHTSQRRKTHPIRTRDVRTSDRSSWTRAPSSRRRTSGSTVTTAAGVPGVRSSRRHSAAWTRVPDVHSGAGQSSDVQRSTGVREF